MVNHCLRFTIAFTLSACVFFACLTPILTENSSSRINQPTVPGETYQATVPDTLDLAERARLGINDYWEDVDLYICNLTRYVSPQVLKW